jgi:hypothetical protein
MPKHKHEPHEDYPVIEYIKVFDRWVRQYGEKLSPEEQIKAYNHWCTDNGVTMMPGVPHWKPCE